MKYKINWVENKNEDWKVAELIAEDGYKTSDVSINRKNKAGAVQWPNFDQIMPGSELEGNLWKSPTNKWFFYPPKPETARGGANKGQGGVYRTQQIKETMQLKQEGIKQSQENKELGIKTASTAAMANAMTIALMGDGPVDEAVSKKMFLRLREWYWHHWDDPKDYPPFAGPEETPVDYPDESYPDDTPIELQ